ncbi:MAG: RnfABCDGE type electron transport complex subunit B [Treponema sp.]|nr:RnfABCDGE type electron transport complex subunit B [Treponema sp.]
MNIILVAIVSVTSIGLVCSAILSVASKLMYVKIDERITMLTGIMPGANCGACGYPGCSGYASALIEENAKINLCTPGGSALLAKISGILGVEAGSIEKKTASVRCGGDCNSRQKKMEYMGIQTCFAAKPVYGGENACAFGCLGFGDCQKVCPSDAICMENDLAHITKNCTGCGLCVKVCPNNLISIKNASTPAFVACSNIEKGAVARKKCTSGCIACTKCVRECLDGAITIENNLAKIDSEKCTGCGRCIEVCVTKCIVSL